MKWEIVEKIGVVIALILIFSFVGWSFSDPKRGSILMLILIAVAVTSMLYFAAESIMETQQYLKLREVIKNVFIN